MVDGIYFAIYLSCFNCFNFYFWGKMNFFMNWMKFRFFIFLFFPLIIMADIPGNTPRPDCSVQIFGLEKLKNYNFYYLFDEDSEPSIIKDSSILTIVGGYGEPRILRIFGKNKNTGKSTQEIFINGGGEELKISLKLDTILGDSIIQYNKSIIELINRNGNKSLIKDNSNWILFGISFLALDLLLLVYILRKRKKKMERK